MTLTTTEGDQIEERARMVREQLERRGIVDARVLSAMRAVPREHFVPREQRGLAYADRALELGHGQTISQPYMVARALELARLEPTFRVLDVGVGSGYQAAVAAQLCARVIGVELLPDLAQRARVALALLELDNVIVHVADGSYGYAPDAPYDAILVAAGARSVPDALVAQLAPAGRLVIPVGTGELQQLTVVERTPSGTVRTVHDACVYVPLRGEHAYEHAYED